MFSKATEYALRATIYIAQKSDENQKVSLAEIAKAIDSPPSFTAKILQNLTKENGIISSVSGPNGGFYLSKKARKYTIQKVLDSMNEKELVEKCILGLYQCSETKPCPMHNEYKVIKNQLMKLFKTKTIQHLADDTERDELWIGRKD